PLSARDFHMPRAYKAGTFDGPPHYRWTKMYNGIRYRVTCEQLGLPRELWTKEGSRQAANSWWEQKKLEIDIASQPPQRPLLPLEDIALAKWVHEFRRVSEKLARLEAEREQLRERGRFDPEREMRLLEGRLDGPEPEDDPETHQPASDVEFAEGLSRELGQAFFADLLDRKPGAEEALLELPEADQQRLRAAVVSVRNETAV